MWKVPLSISVVLWILLIAGPASRLITGSKPSINRESYDRIQLGMTSQEVEKILGGPAGDYGPGKGQIVDYGISR